PRCRSRLSASLTMMHACASAAKLRGGGPILNNGERGPGRATANLDSPCARRPRVLMLECGALGPQSRRPSVNDGRVWPELPDIYSITLSARFSKAAGTVSPSALAAFMLMVRSTLVDCSTLRIALAEVEGFRSRCKTTLRAGCSESVTRGDRALAK